jgi:hypothetical protein
MRLTLRTLLAYLDQILDDADAHELEQKIRESELASQLVHRIRSVLGQRRMAALDVHATGLGKDANSVAEYLDNTLRTDQISDFERVCLESDVHLSEVAACHQILTLVLGEPASVPEGLKEKVYRLPHERTAGRPVPPATGLISEPAGHIEVSRTPIEARTGADQQPHRLIDEPSLPPTVTQSVSTQPRDTSESARSWDEDEQWTEAPDYLKRPRRRRWIPIAGTTLVAFCLAMAVLRGMGPLDRDHPLARRFGLFARPESTELADAASSDVENGLEPAASDVLAEPSSILNQAADDLQPMVPPSQTPVNSSGVDTSDTVDESQAELPAEASQPPAAVAEDATIPAAPTTEDLAFDRSATGDDAGSDVAELPLPTSDNQSSVPPDKAAELVNRPPTAAEAPPSDEVVTDRAPPSGDADVTTDSPAVPDAATESSGDSEDAVVRPTLVNPLATRSNGTSTALPIPPRPAPSVETDAAPTAADATSDADATATPPVPTRTQDVGRFLDPQQVLVKFDPESGLWQRVEVGTRLQVGDLLMSLPTYRSPLVLTSGMQVSLIGGTRIEVLELGAGSTPFVRLEFGRLAIATFAQAGTTFGLRWSPDHSGVLTLADMNTTVAVELMPTYLPGSEPEAGPPHQVLHIYVTSGSAEWSSEAAPVVSITAGQRLTLVDEYPAVLKDMPEEPAWIDGRDVRPRDPMAARDLAERLGTDRPVSLVLKEEADSRRFELRSLAVCSLAYLGDFDPLFVALNDAKLRSYWPAQSEVLAHVPGFSSEMASSVKKAIVQRHGEEGGQQLYRMLWGYSPAQLADGAAADLVDFLDHPSLDFRIVASELLKTITGQPSLYRANAGDRDPQRRAAVSRWRKMLDSGEIVYRQPPEIVQLLNEVAPQN